jgi:hypothetical protein
MDVCTIIVALSLGSFLSIVGLQMSIADRENGIQTSLQEIRGSVLSI